MLRDFSDQTRQTLLSLVKEVEHDKWCDFTDWIGDRWYDFEDLIGELNIKNYVNNVNEYHKKVIDKNNATIASIEKIFSDVKAADSTYAVKFSDIENSLNTSRSYIESLAKIIDPSAGNFTVSNIANVMKKEYNNIENSNVEVYKDLFEQNVNGNLVFDEDYIKETLGKDPTKIPDAQQKALIAVLQDLRQETNIPFTGSTGSAVSVGNDHAGMDILDFSSYFKDDSSITSGSALSAHYAGTYLNIMNYMATKSKEKSTFASSLIEFSNGNNSLNIFGTESTATLNTLFGGMTFSSYLAKYESEYVKIYAGKVTVGSKISSSGKFDKNFDGLKNKLDGSAVYDPKTGKFLDPKDCDYAKNIGTIGEIKQEGSVSASILEGTLSGKTDWGSGSITAKVGTADAHEKLSAGLYVLDKDGSKKFAPGVNAEIGASISAIRINADGTLGNENFGGYGKGEVSAATAEAKASAVASIFGNDGKLNIQAKVGASAEAKAVEAKGSAGVKILGSSAGVTGSVAVGIGAHADVGITNGKLRVDVGAYLGVGASVGFEVDTSGIWNGICSGAKSFFCG